MGGLSRCFEGLRSVVGRAGVGDLVGRVQLALCGFAQENKNGVCCPVGKSLCRERDKKFICGTQGICRHSGYAVKAIWHGG